MEKLMKTRSKRQSRIIAVLGIIIIISWIWCWWSPVQGGPPEVTTIYISRHAEKLDNSQNPPLSPAGLSRAGELAHVLTDAGVEGVYATSFQRTRQTGAPTAAAAGVAITEYDAFATRDAVEDILAGNTGKTLLIVGHSNTLDEIAEGLGVTEVPELAESQFDRLFVVHVIGSVTHLDRLRYGAETP